MSKELKYVECPNCGEVFDDSDKFKKGFDAIGINTFRCLNCQKDFKYPSNKNYIVNIVLVVFALCLYLILPLGMINQAILQLFILLISIQGVVGQIQKNKLQKEFPDWENRLHNTEHTS